jgi:hypothetical protein
VGGHIYLSDYQPDSRVTEQEIIYYSDKRINHDMVVPLEKRLEYILDRYAKNEETLVKRIEENSRVYREVKKKIFRHLRFTPEDIIEMVN